MKISLLFPNDLVIFFSIMQSNICKTRPVAISRFQADVLSLGLDFTRTQWNFPSRILHWQNPPVKCRCSTNTSTTRSITSSEFTVKILNDSYHNVTISAQSNTKCPEYAPLSLSLCVSRYVPVCKRILPWFHKRFHGRKNRTSFPHLWHEKRRGPISYGARSPRILAFTDFPPGTDKKGDQRAVKIPQGTGMNSRKYFAASQATPVPPVLHHLPQTPHDSSRETFQILRLTSGIVSLTNRRS